MGIPVQNLFLFKKKSIEKRSLDIIPYFFYLSNINLILTLADITVKQTDQYYYRLIEKKMASRWLGNEYR